MRQCRECGKHSSIYQMPDVGWSQSSGAGAFNGPLCWGECECEYNCPYARFLKKRLDKLACMVYPNIMITYSKLASGRKLAIDRLLAILLIACILLGCLTIASLLKDCFAYAPLTDKLAIYTLAISQDSCPRLKSACAREAQRPFWF